MAVPHWLSFTLIYYEVMVIIVLECMARAPRDPSGN